MSEKGTEKPAKSRATVKPYLSPGERNDLIDGYQDQINRIVGAARNRGLPAWIETDDLRQRLRLSLCSILDRYQPRHGATLDTYVTKCLNHEIVKAINRENNIPDGVTATPGGRGRPLGMHGKRGASVVGRRRQELVRVMKIDVENASSFLDETEIRVIGRWLRGFNQEEIGVHLRMSQPTASRALSRALGKLRNHLAPYRSLFAPESETCGPKVTSDE